MLKGRNRRRLRLSWDQNARLIPGKGEREGRWTRRVLGCVQSSKGSAELMCIPAAKVIRQRSPCLLGMGLPKDPCSTQSLPPGEQTWRASPLCKICNRYQNTSGGPAISCTTYRRSVKLILMTPSSPVKKQEKENSRERERWEKVPGGPKINWNEWEEFGLVWW